MIICYSIEEAENYQHVSYKVCLTILLGIHLKTLNN